MRQGDSHKLMTERIEKLEVMLFELVNQVSQLNQFLKDAKREVSPESSLPFDSDTNTSQAFTSLLITFDDEEPGVTPSQVNSPPLIVFDEEESNSTNPQAIASPSTTINEDQEIDSSPLPETGREVRRGAIGLHRMGIILLLLGLGFLFKYSIDREWLTPPVRVLFGMVLGFGLIGFGLQLKMSRRVMGTILMGGGITAFYITGYLVFQLYPLVPSYWALSFMTGTTLLAFILAVRQNLAALSWVAVIGGLGTPFLLATGSGNIPGLALYTCLVLSGAMTVFYFKPWRSLLWSSWTGGWIALGLAIDKIYESHPEWFLYSWSAQAGLLFLCALFWMAPLAQKGGDWQPSSITDDADATSHVFGNLTDDRNSSTALVVALSPFFTFAFSRSIWILSDVQWGSYLLGGALIFSLIALFQWGFKTRRELVALHSSVATLLLTLALYYLLDGNRLFLAYAVEAAILKTIGHKIRQPAVGAAASMLFAGVGLWFVARQFEYAPGNPIFNDHAATDLTVILLVAFSSTRTRYKNVSRSYAVLAYLGLLAWLFRELNPMANGNALVSISWGTIGFLLIWAGLRRNQLALFKTGFATTVLLAIKLLTIDLAHLDVIWKISIFLGSGAALLLISFWRNELWKMEPVTTNPSLDTSFKPYARKVPPGA